MADKPKSKRRNMKSFKLEEISVVDKPAQEGAKMALMKRNASGDDLSTRVIKYYLDKGSLAEAAMASLAKSAGAEKAVACWPGIASVESALQSVVRNHSLSDEDKVRMMKSSVKDFLAFTKERLPDMESHLLKAVSTEDDGMNLQTLQKQMMALSRKLDGALTLIEKTAANRVEKSEDDGDLDIEKAGGDNELPPFLEEAEKAEDEELMPSYMEDTEKAEDDEYEFPADMETEKQDEEAEPEKPTSEGGEEEPIAAGASRPIGGKRATKRQRAEDDQVLKIGEHVIRKSAIGDTIFDVLKSQQSRIDSLAKQAREERDMRELVEFAKVAEDELQHLPGSVEEKAVVLKRLSGVLSTGERTVLSRMLKAGNAGVSAAFASVGHKASKAASGDSFAKRVNEIRTRDSCSRVEAMQKARKEHPEEYSAYQGN